MTDLTTILMQGLFIAGLGAAFYLVLVRPQLQRLKRHRAMLAGLRPGDRIATVGGLLGTIARTDGEEFLIVNVADIVAIGDSVRVTITRKSVDALVEPSASRVPASASPEPAKVSL